MNNEPQFLSFKGLKQYTPEDGWGQVNAILQSHTQNNGQPQQAATPAPQPPRPQQPIHQAQPPRMPENIPTLTDVSEQDAHDNASSMFDPLINELFEQLREAPSDELTQTWRTIAAEVNLLTQRMALQRELQERLQKLDQDLVDLRGNIMQHLNDVQQAADQQLTSARLRAEVSALAQTKLAAKLGNRR
jgi:hypothetical protein